jgi:hypothetical protein
MTKRAGEHNMETKTGKYPVKRETEEVRAGERNGRRRRRRRRRRGRRSGRRQRERVRRREKNGRTMEFLTTN